MAISYKVTGSGDTPRKAISQIDAAVQGLVGKLSKAKVSTNLSVEREVCVASFELKRGQKAEEVSFKLSGEAGFDVLLARAEGKHELAKYDGSYAVERYLTLTEEQKRVADGEKKPTAGYDAGESFRVPSFVR